jgi:hypothetical protein
MTVAGDYTALLHKEGPDRLVLEAGASIDLPNSQIIVVAPDGSDTTGTGSWLSPVATLTKAFTLVTTSRLVIYVLPGSFVEAAGLVWPNINGIRVIGLGKLGNMSVSCAGAGPVLTINPTYTAANFQWAIENIYIPHPAQVGISIDNAGLTHKMLGYFAGLSTWYSSSGDSIHVAHTVTTQAIRISGDGLDEIAGLISLVAANSGDRFRVRNSTLMGGLSSTGAVASEITLLNTIILAGGLSAIDGANKFNHIGCGYRTNADPSVYTQLADAWATYP